MKKINGLFYIIGIVCIFIAGYILICSFFDDTEMNINFNEDEEIEKLNNKLSEIGSPLGWLIIVDGINNQDDNGNYVISFDENLLGNYKYRQLFVMEYILSVTNNYDNFIVLDMEGNVINEIPTSDFTLAYLEYNEYNAYYNSLFGEYFDSNKATKGNTQYDGKYVYYDNRRAGSNGVYVSMIQAKEVEYDKGIYTANVIITYSTMASMLLGSDEDVGVIKYTMDIDNNLILSSFTIKDR